jgi:hypothetical protein
MRPQKLETPMKPVAQAPADYLATQTCPPIACIKRPSTTAAPVYEIQPRGRQISLAIFSIIDYIF